MKLYMLELGVFRAFREFVCKRYSDTFSDLFSEKGRRKSYASLLSFMFVHQVIRMCEIAKEMPSQGKDVACSTNVTLREFTAYRA